MFFKIKFASRNSWFYILAAFALFITACQSKDSSQSEQSSQVVFWGDFEAGDLVHYYTFKEVLKDYGYQQHIEMDSVFEFTENIVDFQSFTFNSQYGDAVNYFFFPNDTVEILVKGNNAYELRNKNVIRQNELDWQYELRTMGMIDFIPEDLDFISARKKFDANMEELKKRRQENAISERFSDLMEQAIKCNYISQLTFPIWNNYDYLSEINLHELIKIISIDEKYLPISMYGHTLLHWAKAVTVEKKLSLTKGNILDVIVENFDGKIRDYLVTLMIRYEIISNKFDYADSAKIVDAVSNSFYKEILLDSYNRKIHEESMIRSFSNAQIKLTDILSVGKDTLVYVDFWASWCVPCKEEMKYYPALIDVLRKGKVKFLFLSMDDNIESWKKDMKTYSFMNETNSFMITDRSQAKIIKDLHVNSIPRYVVFQDKNVLIRNALRPGEIKRVQDLFVKK